MLGFAEYCRVIGHVRFVECFSSFSIDSSVLAILASLALRSTYFLLRPRFGTVLFWRALFWRAVLSFLSPVWWVRKQRQAPKQTAWKSRIDLVCPLLLCRITLNLYTAITYVYRFIVREPRSTWEIGNYHLDLPMLYQSSWVQTPLRSNFL